MMHGRFFSRVKAPSIKVGSTASHLLKRQPTVREVASTAKSTSTNTIAKPASKPFVRKAARVAAVATAATAVVGAGVAVNRWQRSKDDFVPNPDNTEFRKNL